MEVASELLFGILRDTQLLVSQLHFMVCTYALELPALLWKWNIGANPAHTPNVVPRVGPGAEHPCSLWSGTEIKRVISFLPLPPSHCYSPLLKYARPAPPSEGTQPLLMWQIPSFTTFWRATYHQNPKKTSSTCIFSSSNKTNPHALSHLATRLILAEINKTDNTTTFW